MAGTLSTITRIALQPANGPSWYTFATVARPKSPFCSKQTLEHNTPLRDLVS